MPKRRNRTGKLGGQKRNRNAVRTGIYIKKFDARRTEVQRYKIQPTQQIVEDAGGIGNFTAARLAAVEDWGTASYFAAMQALEIFQMLTERRDVPPWKYKMWLRMVAMKDKLASSAKFYDRVPKEMEMTLEGYLKQKALERGQQQPITAEVDNDN